MFDIAITTDALLSLFTLTALEIVLDVARNAANKIAVTFGADQANVAEGVEYYDVDERGELVYGLDPQQGA